MEQLNKNKLHQIFKAYILNQNEESLKVLYINYKNLIYSIAYSFLKIKKIQKILFKIYF